MQFCWRRGLLEVVLLLELEEHMLVLVLLEEKLLGSWVVWVRLQVVY
jgi:hypothetical protein